MQPFQAKTQPAPVKASRPTHVRHVVLGLTVAAYMITYMDRNVLAAARPVIRDELGISLVMMGWITSSFRLAYALFQIPGGLAGRPLRGPACADSRRQLVECFYRPDRPRMECRIDADHPDFLRPRRSRRVPHRHPVAGSLDAPD